MAEKDLATQFEEAEDLGKAFEQAQDVSLPTPVKESSEETQTGIGEALLHGATSGATLGFSDRIEAAGKSALGSGDYDELLKSIRERNRRIEAERPYTTGAAKIGGGVAGILLGGKALAAAKGAQALAGAAKTAPTFANTLKTGAQLGAISGAAETEDLTDLTQTAKDTFQGAAGGALGGAVLHGAGKGLQALGRGAKGTKEFVEELPILEEGLHAAKKSFRGESLNSPENRKVLAEGAERVINKIQEVQKHISENYNKAYDTNLILDKNAFLSLSPKARQTVGKYIQLAEDGSVTPIQARAIDSEIKALQKIADKSYSPVYKTGDVNAYDEALSLKGELQEFLGKHLNDEAKSLLSLANQQNYLISNVRAKLNDLPAGLRKGLGTQDEQYAYDKAVKGLTDDFLGASKGNAADANRIDEAFQLLSKLEDSSAPLPNALPRDSKKLLEEIGTLAKDARVAELGAKRSEFGGLSHGGFSLKSIPVHVGQGVGGGAKVAKDTALAPIVLTRDLVNAATNQSPTAAKLAQQLKSSTDATTKKAGEMLTNVMMEPDVSRRKALMFSLSQQSWFRDIAGKYMGLNESIDESSDFGAGWENGPK